MWPFTRKPREKRIRRVEVGEVQSVVYMKDGTKYMLYHRGYYTDIGEFSFTTSGREVFNRWLDRMGERRTISVGNGVHLPLSDLAKITSSEEAYIEEVEE